MVRLGRDVISGVMRLAEEGEEGTDGKGKG